MKSHAPRITSKVAAVCVAAVETNKRRKNARISCWRLSPSKFGDAPPRKTWSALAGLTVSRRCSPSCCVAAGCPPHPFPPARPCRLNERRTRALFMHAPPRRCQSRPGRFYGYIKSAHHVASLAMFLSPRRHASHAAPRHRHATGTAPRRRTSPCDTGAILRGAARGCVCAPRPACWAWRRGADARGVGTPARQARHRVS